MQKRSIEHHLNMGIRQSKELLHTAVTCEYIISFRVNHCEKIWQISCRCGDTENNSTYRSTSAVPSPPGRSAIGNLSSQSARSCSISRILVLLITYEAVELPWTDFSNPFVG